MAIIYLDRESKKKEKEKPPLKDRKQEVKHKVFVFYEVIKAIAIVVAILFVLVLAIVYTLDLIEVFNINKENIYKIEGILRTVIGAIVGSIIGYLISRK